MQWGGSVLPPVKEGGFKGSLSIFFAKLVLGFWQDFYVGIGMYMVLRCTDHKSTVEKANLKPPVLKLGPKPPPLAYRIEFGLSSAFI